MSNPPCPNCKGRMVSNGVLRWRCIECGHSPAKMKVERKRPDYSKRPPCPYCGAHYALKHTASEYKCGSCHRCFQADWEAQRLLMQEIRGLKADAVVD